MTERIEPSERRGMMKDEDRKIDLMKHALGWPKCYRNYYAAGGGDLAVCNELVSTGHMIQVNCSWYGGPSVSGGPVYQVTQEGRDAIKEGILLLNQYCWR